MVLKILHTPEKRNSNLIGEDFIKINIEQYATIFIGSTCNLHSSKTISQRHSSNMKFSSIVLVLSLTIATPEGIILSLPTIKSALTAATDLVPSHSERSGPTCTLVPATPQRYTQGQTHTSALSPGTASWIRYNRIPPSSTYIILLNPRTSLLP